MLGGGREMYGKREGERRKKRKRVRGRSHNERGRGKRVSRFSDLDK